MIWSNMRVVLICIKLFTLIFLCSFLFVNGKNITEYEGLLSISYARISHLMEWYISFSKRAIIPQNRLSHVTYANGDWFYTSNIPRKYDSSHLHNLICRTSISIFMKCRLNPKLISNRKKFYFTNFYGHC